MAGSIELEYLLESKRLIVHLFSDFDHELMTRFTAAYHQHEGQVDDIWLDLQQVTYLDSTIVTGLISFCEYVNQQHADAYIMNMNDEVLEEFRLLNLHKFFKPEYCRKNMRVEWAYHGTSS